MIHPCRLPLVLLFALTSSVWGAKPADYNANWPQWRGPAGNGLVLHGNPPLEWNESKNIKWKVPIPGQGHATPVIWEDKIFILSAVPTGKKVQPPAAAVPAAQVRPQDNDRPQDGERRRRGRGRGRGGFGRGSAPTEEYAFTVLCLNRADGKTLWKTEVRKEVPHQGVQRSNTHASGSPVTDGEHLIAYFGSSGLYCLDMAGKVVWSKDLGKVSVTFGEASSPALAGNRVIVIQDNNGESFLYAFDKKTGKELWKKSRDERSGWGTPYIMERDGKVQAVISGSNAIRSYDVETGDVLWHCSGLGSNPVPMVVSDNDSIYAMSGHRSGAALGISLKGKGDLTDTGAVRWTITRGTPYVPSPLLYNGLLYFCQRNSGVITCVDPESGTPHYSEQRLEGASGIYASPIGVNNLIYWPSQNGATVIFENSKTLKVKAVNQLDEPINASPAVVGDELYLRGSQHLYCIKG